MREFSLWRAEILLKRLRQLSAVVRDATFDFDSVRA